VVAPRAPQNHEKIVMPRSDARSEGPLPGRRDYNMHSRSPCAVLSPLSCLSFPLDGRGGQWGRWGRLGEWGEGKEQIDAHSFPGVMMMIIILNEYT